MINFKEKWDKRYCAPGGKVQFGETPKECIIREFKEETGLKLIDPFLRGIVQWIDDDRHLNGLIFIYQSTKFEGNPITQTKEGILRWVPIDEISKLDLFPINKKFINLIFDTSNFFEGKFYIDQKTNVKSFELYEIPGIENSKDTQCLID